MLRKRVVRASRVVRIVRVSGGGAGVTVPVPPFAARMILRYDDTSPVYSDTAGTTPVTADGSAVRRIGDVSGNGYHATLVSGRTAATLKTALYAQPAVRFATSAMTLGQPTGLVSALNTGSAWSAFAFFKRNSTSDGFLFYKGQSGSQRVGLGHVGKWGNYSTVLATSAPTGTTQPHSYGYAIYPGGAPAGAGSRRVFVAGAAVESVNTATQSTANAVDDILLGGFGANNSFDLSFDLCALCVFADTLYPHEYLQLHDYYHTRFAVTNPFTTTVRPLVVNGNSFMAQVVRTTAGLDLPEAIRQGLSMPLGSVHNLAVGSKRTDEITAENPTLADPLRAYFRARGNPEPAYLMFEGINDRNAAHIATEFAARQSAGWDAARFVTGTIPPTNSAPTNVTRNAENVTVIAGVGQAYTADAGRDATIGTDAAGSNATYFPDGLHWSAAAADIGEPYFQTTASLALATVPFHPAYQFNSQRNSMYL